MTAVKTFPHIVAGQILLGILCQTRRLSSRVDGSCQRAAETAQVSAAIHRVDVVGETEDRFRIRIVVLQRYFHGDLPAVRKVAFSFKVNRLVMQYGFSAIQMLDKFCNAAAVEKLL